MIDLHSHTTASDGQHSPDELLALAASAGVTVLAVTMTASAPSPRVNDSIASTAPASSVSAAWTKSHHAISTVRSVDPVSTTIHRVGCRVCAAPHRSC